MGTDEIFVNEAIRVLKMSVDQYSELSQESIDKIQNIIEELESILEEER